jgi:uncharacterized protein (TIGR04222 family)
MNPYELDGPSFLGLYLLLLATTVVAAFVVRRLLRLPAADAPESAVDLSPYEIAFLSGGARTATDAGIVRLVHRGVVQLDERKGLLGRRGGETLTDAHPLEKAIFNAAGATGGKPVAAVRRAVAGTANTLRSRLDEVGLLVSGRQANYVSMAAAGTVLLVGVFGLVKVFVGLARDKPVGFLIVLLIVTAAVAIAFFAIRPFRSRRGDTLLARLKHDNTALEYAAGRRLDDMGDADLVLAMGLFGMGVLAGGPLARVHTALRAPAGLNAANASAGGSSCSGTTCGGGAGAGCGGGGGCGGGCGGGGCGGCGGG